MVDLPPKGRCVKCRYDLRGIKGKICPECGAPTDSVCVRIADPRQFHRARAALEHEGLLVRARDPGGSLGSLGMVEGLPVDGWLWVDPNNLDRVEACLDHAGVVSQINARPIVDRSEPACPNCSTIMDPNGPEMCGECGAEFQWVEIEGVPEE